MSVWVLLLHNTEVAVPIRWLLALQEVKLVGNGPPDMTKSGEPGDDILQIAIIRFRRHLGIAPTIVRMKQDQIGFDLEITKLYKTLFQVPEKLRVEARIVV